MIDEDVEELRLEIARLQVTVDLLTLIVTPLIGAILADLTRHGTSSDMLLRIQNMRHRVRQSMRASDGETDRQKEIRVAALREAEKLLDSMVEAVDDFPS